MPYRKLKAALTEQGDRGIDLANYLDLCPSALPKRMTSVVPWTLAEAYKTLDFIHKPHDMIFDYFPPEGRVPQ